VKLTNDSIGAPLSAAYHFGSPETGKYLSQFITAQVSFVNHIPAELLGQPPHVIPSTITILTIYPVGPTFPLNHPVDPSTRYPTTLFSKPVPAFINPVSKHSALIKAALVASSSQEKAKALSTLYAAALTDLPEIKRYQQVRAGFGFFEQALGKPFSSPIHALQIVVMVG